MATDSYNPNPNIPIAEAFGFTGPIVPAFGVRILVSTPTTDGGYTNTAAIINVPGTMSLSDALEAYIHMVESGAFAAAHGTSPPPPSNATGEPPILSISEIAVGGFNTGILIR